MSVGTEDKTETLWGLIWGRPEVDPNALARAVVHALEQDELDTRTRLLVRDSAEVLERYWGAERWSAWVRNHAVDHRIEAIRREDLGPPGFLLSKEQLVPTTEPNDVRRYFRELGEQLPRTIRLQIGGSIALILPGYLARSTTDIDVVDEVPEEVRLQRPLLNELKARYRLELAHFGSHYLPTGWPSRLRSVGSFGRLQVELVDPYDVFVGKLFSRRSKDLDDLRAIDAKLEKARIIERLRTTTDALRRDDALLASAQRSWYILYGEPLPPPVGDQGMP